MNENMEFYKSSVPIYFLNEYTGETRIYGYSRFSFYNAKEGKIILFYNIDNDGYSTSERFYFQTELNLTTYTVSILTESISEYGKIDLYELKPEENERYLERYNETFNNFENLQQSYPSGNTFNYNDGTYEITV